MILFSFTVGGTPINVHDTDHSAEGHFSTPPSINISTPSLIRYCRHIDCSACVLSNFSCDAPNIFTLASQQPDIINSYPEVFL